jgi:hypothetical protein
MATGTQNATESPLQTQESEITVEKLQVGASGVDAEEKSNESSTNVAASFSCENCGSTQNLKEHIQVH